MKSTAVTKKKSPAKKKNGVAVSSNHFPIVAIGASAGGLEAITELLKNLPHDTGMAFIYVQHLSPDHKSMLTEILSKATKMKVQDIDDMDKIKPDNLFIIPYNKGIEVTDGHIKLIPRSESSAAISIDILFSSLAHVQKERVIGIILSGSAHDGTRGMKDIKHEGGLTFAQDDTAKFTSMPQSAIAAGTVDFILSPKEIALELARLSKHPFIKSANGRIKQDKEDLIDNGHPDLKKILNHLYKATRADFSQYKMNTIKRRIIRRMLLYKIKTLSGYAKLLSEKKEETDILYQDLLINVTSFFRDSETHKYLKATLLPKLLKSKKQGEPFRVWVTACASGEEAYSIAMMLLEIQDSKAARIPVQVFATDLSEQAIGKARVGLYSKQDLESVSPKRIQRFFTKAEGGFRINKAMRDICVFAQHDILIDPPFSRLDFISCCNLFIYLDTPAQKKALNTFQYALNDDGFLMLGKSETTSSSPQLFTAFNKKYKIFLRKNNSGIRTLPALSTRFNSFSPEQETNLIKNKTNNSASLKKKFTGANGSLDSAIDKVLVSEFMPASVVINHAMEIQQFRGITDLYFTHAAGKATFNILKMARPEIAFELRNAISTAIKTKSRVRKTGIEMKINSAVRIISVEAVPLKIDWDEPLLLILFTEQEQVENFLQHDKGGKTNSAAKDRRIKKLEEELTAAHADALAHSQEQEAFAEELQSANEEVVSSNEELQTLNEELETSKEEIESSNEELITTNQELQIRNDLLNESYEYSEAIAATMHDPMIVLDKSLRVKSANPAFYKRFKVKQEATEGMLLYDLGNKQWNIPALRELLEDIISKNSDFHDYEVTHSFPDLGDRVMLLNASRIIQKVNREQLILFIIHDVTEVRKKTAELLAVENKYLGRFKNLLLQTPVAIVVMHGNNYMVELANNWALGIIVKDKSFIGKPLFQSMPEVKEQIKPILDKVMQSGIPFNGNEFELTLFRNDKNEKAYFNLVYEPIREDDNTISGIIATAAEITEQVTARKKIEESEMRFRNMVENAILPLCILKGESMILELGNEPLFKVWNVGKEALGKPFLEILPELKDQPFMNWLLDVYHNGVTLNLDEIPAHFIRKNGAKETCYFNFVYQPYRETDETISGVMAMATDITKQVNARKRIEESDAYNRSILESSPDCVKIIDTGGRISFMNANGLCIMEIDDFGSVKNKLWTDLWGKENSQLISDAIAKSMKGEIMQFEAFCATAKGTPKWWDVMVSPVIEPATKKVTALIAVSRDVTQQVNDRKRIEEGKRLYEAVTQSTPDLIYVFDLNYRFTYGNEALLKMWGRTWDESIGKGLLELGYEPWHAEMHVREIDKVIATKEPIRGEVSFPHATLGKRIYDYIFVPVIDHDGKVEAIAGTTRDITEQVEARKQIEESQKQFSALANNIQNLAWIADGEGYIYWYNQRWYDYTGTTLEEMKGWGWEKVHHPNHIKRVVEFVEEAWIKNESWELIFPLRGVDGEYKWFLTRAYPVCNDEGKIVNWIGTNTDITEQKTFAQQLELKVEERTKELEEKNIELQKMNKELEAFTFISSHDLQEPLRKIQTFAGRIVEEENQNLSDNGKDMFNRMRKASYRMQTLIQDLLAFSRISIAERNFETTNLNKIVEVVMEELKTTIEEKKATIKVHKMCDVKIIPFQFNQLIHNLISNALKFSNPATPPHIIIKNQNIKYIKANDANVPLNKEYCHITVTDNGIGFENKFSEKIFEVFQRLHGKDEYPGTGIGLAIIKKIVENHKGVITATSELGRGARFDIYIPV